MGRPYLYTALVMLCLGLCFGILAVLSYLSPDFLKEDLGFAALRPLHVSSVLFWIIMGSVGAVYSGLQELKNGVLSSKLSMLQWALWLMALIGIFVSYFTKRFGGREYWEFPPYWAAPLLLSWILFVLNISAVLRRLRDWPVYVWMWCTGALFFLFIFIENYLWLFPYFRQNLVADMTLQWKVNGSLVGAWNQMLYGSMFFLMDRISGNSSAGRSKMAFFMYFLGLFNLMFNWGHHIYTLPTQAYVKYLGYSVSMTEWLILLRILYNWKQSLQEAKRIQHLLPYRFLVAADFWVFLNLIQAILMSIPALNLYTHGTHVTVAHAMGTTIGINSMILLAVCFSFLKPSGVIITRAHNTSFWLLQGSLLLFWLSLLLAGIHKGQWLHAAQRIPYSTLMDELRVYFVLVLLSGTGMAIAFMRLAVSLFKSAISPKPNA